MIIQKQIRLTKLALALSVALAVSPTFAQNTTSAVGGRVSGADGSPASGATVSIVHAESGSVSRVTAGADGRYSARGLRVGGPYTITIEKGGVVEKVDNVYLTLAETATVDATLGAPAMQVVTVTGQAQSAKFNKSNMGAGTNIGRAEIDNLGSIDRSLADYARKDPRLSQTDKDRGEISAAGQNSRFNSITIDGVSISDTFGLEANGLPTERQPISIDAIQSVQVNISNYDVTQKGYTGANINAVTKSGTNTWHGSVYSVFRDEQMVGERYSPGNNTYTPEEAFKQSTTGLTLGGPLIKDKLFVFASHEESSSSRDAPQFGPIGGSLDQVGITQDMISKTIAVARDKYGIDIGDSNVAFGPQTTKESLVKLDWNINDDHRANLRWQKTDQAEPRFTGLSRTGLSLSSYHFRTTSVTESVVGQWFADWTPNFSTELKVSRRDWHKGNINNSNLPQVELEFTGPLPAGADASVATGARRLLFGTEGSRHFNDLSTKTDDIYASGTWVLGSHEIKFGGDYANNEMFNAFLQNTKGNYKIGCTNQSATFQYQNPALLGLNCSTSSSELITAAVLENFRRGRLTSYSATLPVEGYTLDDSAAKWSLMNVGLFAQDTWAVSPRLNLTYGVRLDQASTGERPSRNATAALARIPAGTVVNGVATTRDTGGFGVDNTNTVSDEILAQPRLGFNYKLDWKRPTQLRGGFGLFGGSAMNVWLGNPFQNSGVGVYTVNCGGSSNPCADEGMFEPNPDAQRPARDNTRAAILDVIAPGVGQPSIWKANFAFDHELPWYGIVFGAEYMHTKANSSLFFENINLGAPTRTNADGREMYWTPSGYNASCFNTSNGTFKSGGVCGTHRSKALSNEKFGNVIRISESSKGGGNLVTLSLTSGRGKELNWGVAYTRTDMKEVSNLGSSTAASVWAARATFNPNENVAANSAYLVKDRLNANLTWSHQFFDGYKSSFGVFYEGRSGKPYSWTYFNDMNGDGLTGNDLMYIPSKFGSGEVIFLGDTPTNRTNETKFWEHVNANPSLLKSAGKTTQRGDSLSQWNNGFDLRFSQQIPGLFKGNKGVFILDIQNFGNMLHRNWGHIQEINFDASGSGGRGGGNARSFMEYAGMQDGKYVYNFSREPEFVSHKSKSQWAVQVTARYEF
ncbi:TonB-dependent receptor [Massilia glaciei]|uniref:Oar protein n=1 Tax=Massilia glaciei TaxID=1524097 RepID=A0A2U2HBW8_9BURK|nr:TonB-dependent receptor [Massilia glaciei]PWF40341.1 Oar protein [Massilia glaciei]